MTNPQPTIAPDYYHTNFTFLVNWVLARYEDLLNPEEKQLINQFQKLDHDSQCLLVRLCSRKGPLFRSDKLQYAEIQSIPTAANHLIAAGLMEENPRVDVIELANLLTKVTVAYPPAFSEQTANP